MSNYLNIYNLKTYVLCFIIIFIFINTGNSDEFPDRNNKKPMDELIINTTSLDINSNEVAKSMYRNDMIKIVHTIYNPSNSLSDLEGTRIRLPEWFVIDQNVSNIERCNSCSIKNEESHICWYEGDNRYGDKSSRYVQYVNITFNTLKSGSKKNFSYILIVSNDTPISPSNYSSFDLPIIKSIDGFGGKLSDAQGAIKGICIYNKKPTDLNLIVRYDDDFQVLGEPKHTLYNGSNITLVCNAVDDVDGTLTYVVYNNITDSVIFGPTSGGFSIEKQITLYESGEYQFKLQVIDSNGERTDYTNEEIYNVLNYAKPHKKDGGAISFALYILLSFIILTSNKVHGKSIYIFYNNKIELFSLLFIAAIISIAAFAINGYNKFVIPLLLFFISCSYLIKSFHEVPRFELLLMTMYYFIILIFVAVSPINIYSNIIIIPLFTTIIIILFGLFDHYRDIDNRTRESEELLIVLIPSFILLSLIIVYHYFNPVFILIEILSYIMQTFVFFLSITYFFMLMKC